jgi:hypothetical protein
MKKHKKRSLKSRAKSALRGGATASGAVSLATLGLTTCQSDGGGVVDPVPPPPLTCKDASHGQNMYAAGYLDSTALTVSFWPEGNGCCVQVDTVYVTSIVGASVDSLTVTSQPVIHLYCRLDSLEVKQVKFTLKGTWQLQKGPCNFQRTFTAKIGNGGQIQISQREGRLPLDVPRDVHIELVDRDGLRVNLRAAVAGEGTPEWRATAGKLERNGRLAVTWELPPDPGYYQIELSVDRGIHGIGFDALALEVS